MSLDEEIALYQFAQGVRPAADLVGDEGHPSEQKRTERFFDLHALIRQSKPTTADVQQALMDSSLTAADIAHSFVHVGELRFDLHSVMNLAGDDYTKAHTFLLHLLKVVYPRRATLGNPADWRYWDLSSAAVIHNLRTKQQAVLEEVYADASYRSEFVHMAKLWYERITRLKTRSAEPDPEPQTHFTFMKYDEMITESIKAFTDKQIQGIHALSHSLEKALAKRYGFEASDLNRIIHEVIERHLRDTYHTNLSGE